LLDLYLPDRGKAPVPCIVYIHGGGWCEGTKSNCPAEQIKKHGYAVACVDYRLSNTAKFPAQIHDVKASVRWLRANAKKYGLDKEKFGAWGDSAGGHLASLLGTSGGVKDLEGNIGTQGESSAVQAVADWYGPTDFTAAPVVYKEGAPYHEYTLAVEGLLGGPVKNNVALAHLANPITYIDANDPPFYIMHGTTDNIVPYSQSQLFHKALIGAGVKVVFEPVKGLGHGFGGGFDPGFIKKTIDAVFDPNLLSK